MILKINLKKIQLLKKKFMFNFPNIINELRKIQKCVIEPSSSDKIDFNFKEFIEDCLQILFQKAIYFLFYIILKL